jgi:4-diphosphocytidyl-2-C-methyl-D-erythritol kinase
VIALPRFFAVLVNPQIEASTPKVFAALGLAPGTNFESFARFSFPPRSDRLSVLNALSICRNDLEGAAKRVAPAIATVLDRLFQVPKVKVARMSGSGATCFALVDDRHSAAAARRMIKAEHQNWWVEATGLR